MDEIHPQIGARPEISPIIGPADSILPSSHPNGRGSDESNRHSLFRPIDIGELLRQTEESVPWIVNGYLARGSLTLLGGPPKLGKSTLAYDAIVAVATGQPFLGHLVNESKVLVLALEEHKRDIVARLRKIDRGDLSGQAKIVFGPLPYTPSLLTEMMTFIAREEIGLVVVDTMHAWWGLSDENDAAEVMRKGFPLLNTIRLTQAAWLGLVHTRKSGGEHGHEIRGSSAILGLVDIAISMKRTPAGGRERSLESVSRYADTPTKLVVEYGEHGYEALGDPLSLSMGRKAEQLWETLSSNGQTAVQLAEATGLSQQDLGRCFAHLEGKVIREGAGHKGDPYRYRRNSILPSSNDMETALDQSI